MNKEAIQIPNQRCGRSNENFIDRGAFGGRGVGRSLVIFYK